LYWKIALEHNGTWDLVPPPPKKKVVGCHWVYAIKVGPNGEVDRSKLDWWSNDILRFITLITVMRFLPYPK